MKGTWWPLPSLPPTSPLLLLISKKPHKWLPTVAVIAVYIWNVCSLCKKSWTSASVKLWDAVTVCIHERPLSRYLSTSRLLFGFWMTESKGRIYFGISVFFFFSIYFFTKVSVLHFLLKLSIVIIYNLDWRKTSLVCHVSFNTAPT